jgi:putative sigma-54 modulation protein
MRIQITGKHLKVTERMREHIEDKLGKLGKFPDVIDAKVILKIEKYLNIAEITLLGRKIRFYGEGRSEDNFFRAFDAAEQKVVAQLKKKKEKIKNHKVPASRQIAEMMMTGRGGEREKISGGEGNSERVILDHSFRLKSMPLDEAVQALASGDRQFLVFLDSQTQAVNVLYKRADSYYGLIRS